MTVDLPSDPMPRLADDLAPPEPGPSAASAALRLTVIYALVAGGWIALSSLGGAFLLHREGVLALEILEVTKGLGFVIATSLMLYALARALQRRIVETAVEAERWRQRAAEADRRAWIGVLTSAVIHDVSNVVAVLTVSADELTARPLDPASRDMARRVSDATTRLEGLLKRLRRLGTKARGDGPSEITSVIDGVVALVRWDPRVRNVSVALAHRAPVWVDADATSIAQIVWNLLVNAAEAGAREVRIEVEDGPGRPEVVIDVVDDGPGLPDAVRRDLFTPGASTKGAGRGLGLVSVLATAEGEGGHVEVASTGPTGTRFRVSLPRGRAPGPTAGPLAAGV